MTDLVSRADREKRSYCLADIHEKNTALLAEIITEWNGRAGPRVGDYIRVADGSYRRFTHNLSAGIQTTIQGHRGSFCIGRGGFVSFSGSLDLPTPKSRIGLTNETQDGEFWFFSRSHAEAHNAVYCSIPCKVYKELSQ